MSRIAYIAVLLYLPLTVVYAQFCPATESLFWNKYFYLLDKLFITALLVGLQHREVLKHRRLVYRAGLGLISVFILYLLLDWREAFNYNAWVITGYCILGISFYSYVLIHRRYDSTD